MIRFQLPWCIARLRAEWRHTPSRLRTARLDARRAWDEYHLVKAERDRARRWAVALENQLAAVRDITADMRATTGARTWADRLETALDEEGWASVPTLGGDQRGGQP